MEKIFTITALLIFLSNSCFATGFELTDIIKEARKNEKLKITQSIQNEKNINNLNNEISQEKSEQNTNEKKHQNNIKN